MRCSVSLQELKTEAVDPEQGFDAFPDAPGIYAIYNSEDKLQFVGITRKIRMSVMGHARDVPDLTRRIRYDVKPDASKEELGASWKELIEQHVTETGEIPPGNRSGNTTWKPKRAARRKPEIRLTPGKGIEDLTVSIEELIDQVVKSCKVVAFIKGSRMAPQCGFSYQMLTILNQNQVDYEVVNVLDEVHNPQLREKLKDYSQWPTIPQLYVDGEFIGGADILTEMQNKGELQKLLQKQKV